MTVVHKMDRLFSFPPIPVRAECFRDFAFLTGILFCSEIHHIQEHPFIKFKFSELYERVGSLPLIGESEIRGCDRGANEALIS
jgi:hypothetical protein